MSQPITQFTVFPNLPAELREKVWLFYGEEEKQSGRDVEVKLFPGFKVHTLKSPTMFSISSETRSLAPKVYTGIHPTDLFTSHTFPLFTPGRSVTYSSGRSYTSKGSYTPPLYFSPSSDTLYIRIPGADPKFLSMISRLFENRSPMLLIREDEEDEDEYDKPELGAGIWTAAGGKWLAVALGSATAVTGAGARAGGAGAGGSRWAACETVMIVKHSASARVPHTIRAEMRSCAARVGLRLVPCNYGNVGLWKAEKWLNAWEIFEREMVAVEGLADLLL